MAFRPFGNTEPEDVTYNGSEVKVISYNGTYVWGKPYTSSLSSTGSGTAYIIRKASQYEHASTSLTTQIPIVGSKNIYYGDSINIEFTCPSGSRISSASVTNNGQSVSVSKVDAQNRTTAFFTVNGNVSVSIATSTTSTLTLTKNANISSLTYKIGSGSYVTVSQSTTVQVAIGTIVYMYATPASGYSTTYTSSNQLTFQMDDDYTFSPTATYIGQWNTIWTGEQTTLIKRINADFTASINIGYAISPDWKYRITTYGRKNEDVAGEVVISQDDLPYRYTINIANIYRYTAIEATASAGSVYNDTVDVTIHSTTAQGEFIITKIEAYY